MTTGIGLRFNYSIIQLRVVETEIAILMLVTMAYSSNTRTARVIRLYLLEL